MSDTTQASAQNDFWNHRAFKIIVGYLVGSWTLLEFMNFTLDRLQFSPYWTEIFLYTLLLFLPSLLIMVFVPTGHTKKIVRIIRQYFPYVNIVTIGVILFFTFSGRALGAMTSEVNYNDESGVNHTATVVNEDFMQQITFHKLKAEGEVDSLLQWMATGIPKAIEMNFRQYQGVSLNSNTKDLSLKERLEALDKYTDYFITGAYRLKNETITVDLKFYSGKGMIHEESVVAIDLLSLADDIKHLILKVTKPVITKGHIDLPFSEFVTDNIEAFEYFNKRNYPKAIEEDSTFSYAYLRQTHNNFFYGSFGEEQRIKQSQKAMEKSGRLPEHDQLRLKAYYFSALGEEDKAITMLKQSLILNPGDVKAQGFYIFFLASKGRDQEAIDYFNKNFHVTNAGRPLRLMRAHGQTEQARDLIKKLGDAISVFDQYKYEGELSLIEKNYERAFEYFDKAKLEEPLAQNIDSMIKVTKYMQKIGAEGLRKFAKKAEGTYMSENRDQTCTVEFNNDVLTLFPQNQYRLVIFPIDSISYFNLTSNSRRAKVTNIASNRGKWNKVKFVQKDDLRKPSTSYWFRMTEDLAIGLKSFEAGDYLLADSLLMKVYAQDTLYYFLKGYLEAIEHITSTTANILPFDSTKTFRSINGDVEVYLEPLKDHYESGLSSNKIGTDKMYPAKNNWLIRTVNKSRKFKLIESEEGWVIEHYQYDHDLNVYIKYVTFKEVK